jgi:short subunit dehydrogenase-like uncharacterized protein
MTLDTTHPWMLYGANGYTGEMIAREAAARGMKPVLAGRSRHKIEPLARELGLPFRVFDLDNAQQVSQQLTGVRLVLLTAGPFSATSACMVEACLAAGAHYLDISGEISVFEHAFAQHQRARAASVALCPGVGFDVIPTDCVAASLKAALPDATHLELAFYTASSLSPGTLKTMIETAAQGGCIRRNGQLVAEAPAAQVRRIDFGEGEHHLAMSAPWGDVSTAFHSTGIPNVRAYLPGSWPEIVGMRVLNLLRVVISQPVVRRALFSGVERFIKGPDAALRQRTPSRVWGEARNAAGERRTAHLLADNGYSLTITGSLAVVAHLLAHHVEGGSYTPSRLLGPGFVSTLPRCGPIHIQ